MRWQRPFPRSSRQGCVQGRTDCVFGQKKRAYGGDAVGELVHVGLADEHGAGLAELSDLVPIVVGHMSGEGDRAARRRHVERVVVVLEDDGNAVERASRSPLASFTIECRCVFERARVQVDHGVELRAALVERLDACEVVTHELDRGELGSLPPGWSQARGKEPTS